jgi:predicted acylesterase/phospholipase RssA/CRP-like cAMP-binding protein
MEDSVSTADLTTSELFASVPESILSECAGRARLVSFPRGAMLARQGEIAAAFYLLLDGSVEVIVERAGEPDEFIDVLGRGDCIGDLALLLGQERTATVRALRECRAVELSEHDFVWLLRASPDFTVQLARTIGARLQRTTHRVRRVPPIERIVAIAAATNVDIEGFRRGFEAGLRAVVIQSASRACCEIVATDSAAKFDISATRRLQDADAILLVGDAADPPELERLRMLLELLGEFRPQPRFCLVLLHRSAPPYRGAMRWLKDKRIRSWSHVQLERAADFERLARRLTGRAVALVLSGGGARGFAHIGVLRAFDDAGIPIDGIAGSSMGAIVAAQHAMGLSNDAIIELMRQAYLRRRGLPDVAIPYVALRSGAATDRKLRQMFGESCIEDLPIPFFCVASNLITAEAVVHERGSLWRGVRGSCSVPGLLPPVRSRGGFLVDGGLLDNLPVAAMRQRCEGRVAASDVSVTTDLQMWMSARRRTRRLPLGPPARMPGIGAILMRSAQLASVRDSRISGMPADLYLHPPVDDFGMGDFDRLEELVEIGRAHAREQLAGWKR